MLLEPGLTFRVAGRFHCRAAWPQRLQLNGGVARRAGTLIPQGDWRLPAAEELRMLVAEESAPAAAPGHLELLAIPAALRQRWWEIAEQQAAAAAMPGYQAFVGEVVELLRFKRLPVPAACAAAVVVSRPGQTSTRVDGEGRALLGFGFGSQAAARTAEGSGAPVAVINLGDEASHLVLLNLGADALRARSTFIEPAREPCLDAFFARQPSYPLVQVRLDPGEGLWFPTPPPAFDGWTQGKSDVDAMLVLHGPPLPRPLPGAPGWR